MKAILSSMLLGAIFGTILIYADVFNWYRIQEMFHFDSFHMYGVIGSSIGVAGISVWFLKKNRILSHDKNEIKTSRKQIRPFGNTLGGLIFGAGWALTGACTAPIFILVGFKWEIGLIALAGALIGTMIYGIVNTKLPL